MPEENKDVRCAYRTQDSALPSFFFRRSGRYETRSIPLQVKCLSIVTSPA